MTKEAITPSSESVQSTPSNPASTGKPRERLPFFIFLATLLGSLIGVAADLSDASGLIMPIVEFVDSSPQLRIVGSNTVLGEGVEVSLEWQEAFLPQTSRQNQIPFFGMVSRTADIQIRGVGSIAAVSEAIDGNVDLLVASEPLTDERITDLEAAGIEITCAAEIGYDVITFVTDINNTLPEISRRDMASILSGSITNWSQVGGTDQPIRILAREGSGTTELVLQSFTGETAFQDHFIPCASNDECLDTALSTPGSLYWVSTTWLRTQPPRYLRPILIRRAANLPPEDPFSENFNPDNYTVELIRPLIMYVLHSDNIPEESTNLAREFLLFVRGVRGQEILETHHFYTYFDPPADVAVPLPAGFGPGSDGLPIVCQP